MDVSEKYVREAMICLPLATGLHTDQQLARPTLGSNPDLGCHILHVEIARQFSVGSDCFCFVANFLRFIHPISGSDGAAGSVVSNRARPSYR